MDSLHILIADDHPLFRKGMRTLLTATAGTEVIGAQLVSLWQGGAIDIVAGLSLINVVLVGVGLGVALRFGVRLRD